MVELALIVALAEGLAAVALFIFAALLRFQYVMQKQRGDYQKETRAAQKQMHDAQEQWSNALHKLNDKMEELAEVRK